MSRSSETKAGNRHDADRGTERSEFNLLRYFSLACISVFVVITSVMCTGFYHTSKRYIRIDAEQHAIPIAENLAPIAFVGGSIPNPGTPEYVLLDAQMREFLKPLRMFKIKIYDTAGRIVYTTDPNLAVGQLDPGNDKLVASLAGAVVSDLETDETVWDLQEEVIHKGTVVETYVPVHRGGDPGAEILGVFEIYQDVSDTYARLPGVIALIVVASVGAMIILYTILFLIVRKAHLIIRSQTQVIRQAKADVEQYAVELEQRVEERTRQLRETLAQQQHDEKMVAIGTLAAGVAHELNTPLGSILGSTQLALDFCSTKLHEVVEEEPGTDGYVGRQQCVQDLQRVESQAKRCREIIRNLVDFSRKSDDERMWEDIGDLTERSILLIEPEARKCGIQIETSIDDEMPPVWINGNEIQQVIVNIMNNAIAAMNDGGVLSINVSNQNQTARLKITDIGNGISKADLPRIFEPFFTTKDVGKGTGLGLSISFRIVKDHGGNILVSSVVGEGSTFIIELPTGLTAVQLDSP